MEEEKGKEATPVVAASQAIEQKIEAFLEELASDPNADSVLEMIVDRQEISFSGPVPPPSVLREYEAVVSGSAERLIALAENGQQNRKRATEKALNNDRLKILLASFVSIILIVASVYCGIIGQTAIGVTLGGSGIISALMTWGRKKDDDN